MEQVSMRQRARRHALFALLVVFATTFVLLLGRFSFAYADDYYMTQTDIDATVNADGSLSVVETRTFDFEGDYHGVYWKIPLGENSSSGKPVDVTIESCGLIGSDGQLERFTESDSGEDGTYTVDEYSSYLELKLYSPHSDETVQFQVSYVATNVAVRWSDTGELYWTFVSEGWDQESENITCTVHLPVAAGESVIAGDNVKAWGHGPLDATVSFSGNDIVCSVPGVGTDEYAAVRVTFPEDWLSEAEVTQGNKLSSIVSEEQANADEANQERMKARAMVFGATGICLALLAATLFLSIRTMIVYRRNQTPHFDDKYFRDVPSFDHPAVLGCLEDDLNVDPRQLTASLMRLSEMGVVKLDQVQVYWRRRKRGRTKTDYRLTLLKGLDSPTTAMSPEALSAWRIDDATITFLFDHLAKHALKPYEAGDPGVETADELDDKTLYMSCIEMYAKDFPQEYDDAYKAWTDTVENECATRFQEGSSPKGAHRYAAAICSVASIIAAVAYIVFIISNELDAPYWLLALGSLAAGVICVVLMLKLVDINEEGVETRAKLVSLKRWLKEFTRLDEAVPQDVVLWNRLLVMAVSLGVADEVIKQLRVAMPEILEDPYLYPVYSWYYMGPRVVPAKIFGDAVYKAHSVSTGALAGSSLSSGGGSGGGFSDGGGGSWGGGGGGGAF
jgi:uncharacterized membrane protein